MPIIVHLLTIWHLFKSHKIALSCNSYLSRMYWILQLCVFHFILCIVFCICISFYASYSMDLIQCSIVHLTLSTSLFAVHTMPPWGIKLLNLVMLFWPKWDPCSLAQIDIKFLRHILFFKKQGWISPDYISTIWEVFTTMCCGW